MQEKKNILINIVRDQYSVDFLSELDCISQLHFFRGKITLWGGESNIYS